VRKQETFMLCSRWDRYDITFKHNKRQCIDFDLTVCMRSICEKAYGMMAVR
jgi:hypothetical protein